MAAKKKTSANMEAEKRQARSDMKASAKKANKAGYGVKGRVTNTKSSTVDGSYSKGRYGIDRKTNTRVSGGAEWADGISRGKAIRAAGGREKLSPATMGRIALDKKRGTSTTQYNYADRTVTVKRGKDAGTTQVAKQKSTPAPKPSRYPRDNRPVDGSYSKRVPKKVGRTRSIAR